MEQLGNAILDLKDLLAIHISFLINVFLLCCSRHFSKLHMTLISNLEKKNANANDDQSAYTFLQTYPIVNFLNVHS